MVKGYINLTAAVATLRPNTLNMLNAFTLLRSLGGAAIPALAVSKGGFKKRGRTRARSGRPDHDRAVRSQRQHWLKGVRP